MMTLAAALLFGMVPQDEARLRDAWPKLAETWKSIESYKPSSGTGELDDEFLKVAGKLHEAFEAGGLYGSEGEYVPAALKNFIKARTRGLVAGGSPHAMNRAAGLADFQFGYGAGGASLAPMRAFLDAVARLSSLEKSGLADEDNVMDELVTARKALKGLAITSDATPGPLRRRVFSLLRALALGEPYPEPAKATEEQAKQFRAWISELGHEEIETREKAMKELLRAGEASLQFLREALKGGDAEIVSRARKLLGFGHAPWAEAKAQFADRDIKVLLEALAPAAPATRKGERK
ncbi:MAG TPA: hypothetical protein VGK61_01315 [Planctomycetota bacterium]